MSKSFIIKKKNMVISDWFGGKTTQLFISPSASTLKELNFDFRLSTATIELEKSDFTPLPGVDRTLMLLDGELKLEHKDHHSKTIPIYDVDRFKGDWNTVSFGKAIDFNLMTTKNYDTLISILPFTKNSNFKDLNLSDYTFIYVYKGNLKSNYGKLEEGDLLVINSNELYELNTTEDCITIHISISLLD